jgi:hypothetical protein
VLYQAEPLPDVALIVIVEQFKRDCLSSQLAHAGGQLPRLCTSGLFRPAYLPCQSPLTPPFCKPIIRTLRFLQPLISFQKRTPWSVLLLAASLCTLPGCGDNAQVGTSGGGFSGSPTAHLESASSSAAPPTVVSWFALSPSVLIGGNLSTAKVYLSRVAPSGGALVLLASANPAIVSIPANVRVPAGLNSASVQLTTAPVTATTYVALTASYDNSVVGKNLKVNPPRSLSGFTVAASPTSLSIQAGGSGSSNVVTTVNSSFNHSLLLNVSGQPAGVTVNLNPTMIASPGAGSSQVDVSVASNVAAGNYSIRVSGTDGITTHSATIQLTVSNGSSGIVGPLTGCVLNQSGHRYQAVKFQMNQSGTVAFNALLFFGATCDPSQWADQFGFGNPLSLGGFGYTFWFHDFPDQLNTSAIWTVGNQTSQCVDYTKAPGC